MEAALAGARAELAAAADDVAHAARGGRGRAAGEGARATTALAERARRGWPRPKLAAARAARSRQPQEVGAAGRAADRGEQKVRIAITDLDLVFVMDTTGSMRRELADLQANLLGDHPGAAPAGAERCGSASSPTRTAANPTSRAVFR